MQLALGINLVINDFVHFMVYLIVDYHFQQDKYLEAFEKHTIVQDMMLVLSKTCYFQYILNLHKMSTQRRLPIGFNRDMLSSERKCPQ